MDRQLIGMRVIDRYELYTGVHQRGDEREISGEPIELGYDELVLFAGRESLL
jgi:hypothetical protein